MNQPLMSDVKCVIDTSFDPENFALLFQRFSEGFANSTVQPDFTELLKGVQKIEDDDEQTWRVEWNTGKGLEVVTVTVFKDDAYSLDTSINVSTQDSLDRFELAFASIDLEA